jgi:hypothetical protein
MAIPKKITELRDLECKIQALQVELFQKGAALKKELAEAEVAGQGSGICDGGCIAVSPIPPCSGCCIIRSPAK